MIPDGESLDSSIKLLDEPTIAESNWDKVIRAKPAFRL
jgi:hypothetical protein